MAATEERHDALPSGWSRARIFRVAPGTVRLNKIEPQPYHNNT